MSPSRSLVAAAAWLTLLGLSAVPTAPARAAEELVPGSARVQAKARTEGKVSVIVRLKALDGVVGRADVRAQARARDELRGRLAGAGVASVRPVGRGPFAALEVDARQLEALLASGLVSGVEENAAVRPHLAESGPLVGVPVAQAAGATGAGQVVVVIDTCVDRAHPALAGRVVAEACSAPDCGNDPYARNGPGTGAPCAGYGCEHGTHVAAIAAGAGSAKGVAPAAGIASIRVFSSSSGSWESVLNALDYVQNELAGRHRIAAVNMSLGSTYWTSAADCDASWASLAYYIDALRDRGILSVVSSGNDYQKAGISAPACVAGALSVGATTDYGAEAVAGFSNSAPVLDLLAPGDLITAAVPGGRYASLRGTSMAASHVAGAVAALRSRMPSASADAIEQALEATGKAVADPGNGLAKPRINVHAALGALGGSTGWRPWAGRGGALAAFPECEAAGARTDCWAPGAGGSLLWNRTEDGNAWSGWADLGGSVEATPECVVAAGGGRIDCFATTTAKRLAQITFDGTAWGGWVDRGGSVTGRPSCVPAAASGPALDCFATGTDKALWRLAFDGTAWKPWQKVGGGATTTLRPECVRRDAHVECFVVDGSKRLKVRRLTRGSWASWKTLGSGFGFVPHCLVSGPEMDCFAQSADHQLLAGYFDGKNWATWRKLGGDVRTQPYCNRLSTGFECYATTAAGALVRRAREGSSWRAWENLGGAVQQRPTCIARNGGARVDCLARGLDNSLQQRSYY